MVTAGADLSCTLGKYNFTSPGKIFYKSLAKLNRINPFCLKTKYISMVWRDYI